jgi:hypothetical protein
MIRKIIANIAARLLRAALVRISSDLDLLHLIEAGWSSSAFAQQILKNAKPCLSRLEVMHVALQLRKHEKLSGFISELGVYKGQSLNEIARKIAPEKVYGFDTFTGLPEFWRDGYPEGAFDVSAEKLDFEKNCILYKGLFDETLPKFLQTVQANAGLIHVDCDLYSSTASALRILAPRIKPGTILVFDEYFNYPGWQEHEYKAFQEFLHITGYGHKYIAYNKYGQQVAAVITNN